jgi:alpha-D-xyloside xylohydrolase
MGHDWYDLNTGRRYAGGQTVSVHAPLDVIPMFVRAGTVLPLGAEVQHTAAQQHAPLEVLVFSGADASFNLYEDAGDGYGYESGEYALTGFCWSEGERTLRIGERRGSYAGMPAQRQLLVHAPGQEAVAVNDTGKETTLQL